MSCYRKLRDEASSITAKEIHRIRTPLNQRTPTYSIRSLQVNDVTQILLNDFCPGGMIRCLGGVYTSKFLELSSIDENLLALSDIPADPG